ncbi:MAG: dethiobiotin synthase [Methylococcales bacterium]
MSKNRPRFQGVFVTGTDTGIGKTRVALGLMEALKSQGIQVSGMKPVATGCYVENGELRSEDAVLLRDHASWSVDYSLVNPYAFLAPVSPHIAARQTGIEICLVSIAQRYALLQQRSEFVVVEGVGGWEVPLNSEDRVSDLAGILGLPIVLVVGLRLGCLNHALLTGAAIQRSGCDLIGWVANPIDSDFIDCEENVATLQTRIPAPLLGLVPFSHTLDLGTLARSLDLDDWMAV